MPRHGRDDVAIPSANANRIVQWMRNSVEALAPEMTIDNYPTVLARGARTFRTTCRLTVGPEKHAGRPTAVVAVKLRDGLWQVRNMPIPWGVPKVIRSDTYALAVVRARVSLYRWTASPAGKARTMFLRVGINGAVAAMPNGDKIVIAEPPFPKEPSTHITTLTPVNGHLIDQRTTNPDYAVWQRWEREVSDAAEIIRRAVDGMGMPVDAANVAIQRDDATCGDCGRFAARDAHKRWRILPARAFRCESCANEIAATFAEFV